ncbi:MAG: response regulator [Lachnospiraceae bacterium]|nr:response regulator [Lachnospiraceae bacterium]MBR1913964.1 response regulator [Lachnospiraceae bacterium]
MLIFAIDDEESILKDIEDTIIRAVDGRAEIRGFRRSSDAMKAVEQGSIPDVVFADIVMPGISGLEFAVRLKETSPDTRIIFVTAHEEYAIEAFKVKAHGYVMKPINVEDVREELESVPIYQKADEDKLEVRCFGHFDVYWRGEPVIFARKQSKELLAYLIDRQGAACTSGEIAMALWKEGNDTKAEQNRIRVIVNDLRNTLKKIGMERVLIREHRELAVRRELIDCDYYRMLEGDMEALNSYRGKYMIEYSWAELTNANLYFKR